MESTPSYQNLTVGLRCQIPFKRPRNTFVLNPKWARAIDHGTFRGDVHHLPTSKLKFDTLL